MFASLLLVLAAQTCSCSCPCDAGPVDTGVGSADASLLDAAPADGGVPSDGGGGGSAGCGKVPPYTPGTYPVVTLSTGRQAILGVPASYNKDVPLPLVTAWCGMGWTAYGCRTGSGVEAAAAGGAILVWPYKAQETSTGTWDLSPTGADVAVFDAILAYMMPRYCVAPRVFAYGRSYGGGMVQTLAGVRGPKLTGVAMTVPYLPNHQAASTPVAMWMQANTGDTTVGGIGAPKLARDKWASVNGCVAQNPPTPPLNQTLRTTYACTARPLTWIEVNVANHSPMPNVGVEMWNFFRGL